MDNPFFDAPILNSPYAYPSRHWELDATGQPTQVIKPSRRSADFITPIPTPRKQKGAMTQSALLFDEGLSTPAQQYHSGIINGVRAEVDKWRAIPNPADWRVTPETARLLQHWRQHAFSSIRPFFCQVEAVETAIWLTEVAPQIGKNGERFLEHLANANQDANPGLSRLALKLATGAGKTTVMAMLIAWQTINAVRRPGSKKFTRGFLIVAPGITIKDRLRVLQPNDPDSYYQMRKTILNSTASDDERFQKRYASRVGPYFELLRGGGDAIGVAGDFLVGLFGTPEARLRFTSIKIATAVAAAQASLQKIFQRLEVSNADALHSSGTRQKRRAPQFER